MKYRTCVCGLTGVLLVALCGVAMGGAEHDALQLRVRELGHGYYTEAIWQKLMADINAVQQQAEEAKDWNGAVEAGTIQARAYRDIRREPTRAMAMLEKLKVLYDTKQAEQIRDVYVLQAEICAEQSNPQGIVRLIYEFKNSRNYDGGTFKYSGGSGRDDPLVVTRPNAKGSSSLTVTAMEKLRQQAMLGSGQRVPIVEVTDRNGDVYRLDNLPWKVTLIDFWLGAWTPWRRSVPYLSQAYREYSKQGFGILGISLDRNPEAGLMLLKEYKAKWPLALDPKGSIARNFGLYGEAGNLLVDSEGYILARNVRGENLVEEVRAGLGLEKE